MIKLIITDMDGTLLRDDKTFHNDLYTHLKQMKELGIKFVVASGNQYELLHSKFKPEVADDIIYISENGAKIVYGNRVIEEDVLYKKDVYHILDILDNYPDCLVVLCGHKKAYFLNRNKDQEEMLRKHYLNYEFVDSFRDIDDHFLKISINIDKSKTNPLDELMDKLPDRLKTVTSGFSWIDIFNSCISKGYAILDLIDQMKVVPLECVAFGDQMNDYEMISLVQYGYVMENGHDDLKKVAYKVIANNNTDSVVRTIGDILEQEYQQFCVLI